MRYLGGHLGAAVSALVDGQLDPSTADRAWAHVHGCPLCRCQVEREGWVKSRLAAMSAGAAPDTAPPAHLLGSLYGLPGEDGSGRAPAAWAAVQEIERRERGRRRTGLALVGAGSVSAAVLGLATLGGPTLGISGAPAAPPPTALTRPVTPLVDGATVGSTAHVHGWLPESPGAGSGRGGPGGALPR
jgi:anti-sigma factor RsiW